MQDLLKRFDELNFVIGLFFTVLALILLLGYSINAEMKQPLTVYTGLAFLLFGGVMMWLRGKSSPSE
jgi:hypothetical protein